MAFRTTRLALVLALAACGRAPEPGANVLPLPEAGGADDGGAPPAIDGGTDPTTPDAKADAWGDQGASTRVRMMAANTTSGSQQSYETPGIHIFQGLLPDIVLIQEFKYAAGDLRALVDTAFGKDFSFYVEPRAGGIPNGIVSRYPILASGVWADDNTPDRAFAYARIDVPGSVDLWAVSIHLLTSGATQRHIEAAQLIGYLNGNVPPTDYVVIGGDLNTENASEQALVDLTAAVVVAAPYPVDQSGNANTSTNRNKPHDWLLARATLTAREVPVSIGAASFAAGLVFDSRVYMPLGDIPPIVAGDSAASGMQHMPVVRDFRLGGAN